jgi:hypothetical protein
MLNYPSFSRSEHCQDGFAIDPVREQGFAGKLGIRFFSNGVDELGCNTPVGRRPTEQLSSGAFEQLIRRKFSTAVTCSPVQVREGDFYPPVAEWRRVPVTAGV